MSLIERLLYDELPCGCPTKATPRFSDDVEELERESVETAVKRYVNATVTEFDETVTYECECGATWTDRESGPRSTNFGEKNPGAGVRLRVEHSPGPMGGTYKHNEEPVVDEP